MRPAISTVSPLVLLALLPAFPLHAQGTLEEAAEGAGFRGWGVRGGLTTNPDQIHGGFHLDFGNFAQKIRFQPNVEVGFGDDLTLGAINADVHYRLRESPRAWSPYVGGGLGLLFWSYDDSVTDQDEDDSEIGGALVGGLEKVLSGGDRFSVQASLGFFDSPDLKVHVGWTFGR